ncbi:MAG TPA: hypothetical protein VHS56_13160 [Candidatus Cybelea sp.]|jgi:hypothetical protein|nr:hypothetical protein [Candidatus Cybelea sp.]
MQRLSLLWACAFCAAALLPLAARSDGSGAAANGGTPPPQIYHIVTSALCARLHETVRPAVAMVLQNDGLIKKSPPLFKDYAQAAFSGAPLSNAGGDSINVDNAGTRMALQRMGYLVLPTAHNLVTSQTLLDDQKFTATTGSASDDKTLKDIRNQLLDTIAFQSASLDLINGFVETQQLGNLQHAGTEYIAEINGSDESQQPIKNTPNPWQDPNTPGLSPNPYAFDPATIPGLAVGYNPISHIMDGLQWTQDETRKREDAAAKSISAAMSQCPK